MGMEQGDGMPEDRLKAHELFQAWEEQCACGPELLDSSHPPMHPNYSSPTFLDTGTAEQRIRQGAELYTQVDNVRQRIAQLSMQLQSPVSS